MEPRIETLTEKKLIGQRIKMTFSENKTVELWRSFMPRRREIKNNLTTELFSIQVYKQVLDFNGFNPHTEFEKWATVEVSDFNTVPDGMETFILKCSLYAVFKYKGLNTDNRIFEYIFTTWLPNSGYLLDDRPHFEILGEKYKNDDPDSEEEIGIPIKRKE
jgi:AraC family transcriptional regulator